MSSSKIFAFIVLIALGSACPAYSQDASNQAAQATSITAEQFQKLVSELRAHEERIKELEAALAAKTSPAINDHAMQPAAMGETSAPSPVAAVAAQSQVQADPHDHMIQLPAGGPALKIRGFADFNLGVGQSANALIFPLGAPAHTTFQFGEFDLFLSSKLTKKISFVSEIIYGSDFTNAWGLDIERLLVTYKPSPYFEISGGRFHTSIGYYNTTFHHGTWFQTATGRPFMLSLIHI